MLAIRYLGHAAFSLEKDGITLLIDPYLTGNPQAPVEASAVSADYILVTHGHGDHIGDTVQIARRTGAAVISNSETCHWLREKGVETHPQHLGGGHQYPFGYLKMTFALHGSPLPDGSYGGSPGGFLLLTNEDKRLYFAGDTGLFGDMKLIGADGLDFAALPIGDTYTMGPDDALRAVKLLQPQVVVPMHYDTFDAICQDVDAWSRRVMEETDAGVEIMQPGDTLILN